MASSDTTVGIRLTWSGDRIAGTWVWMNIASSGPPLRRPADRPAGADPGANGPVAEAGDARRPAVDLEGDRCERRRRSTRRTRDQAAQVVGVGDVAERLLEHEADVRGVHGFAGYRSTIMPILRRGYPEAMSPEQALLRVVHCLDRVHDNGFRAKAFVRALDVVRSTPADELAARAADDTLTELDGIGDSSAQGHHRGAARRDARLPRQARRRVAGARSRPRASGTGRRCGATATCTRRGATAGH